MLGVEAPDEFDQISTLLVVQNDVCLVEDQTSGAWLLSHLGGEVILRTPDAVGENLARISLGDDDYLVLRLSGRDLNQGRRVKQVSRGSYLVVAPSTWSRHEGRSGPAPATPEPVCVHGHRAHFFDLPGDNSVGIALLDGSGRTIEVASGGPCFQPVGRPLPDACENLGPLFVTIPPRLQAAGGNWESVGKIVVGEEGKRGKRWRTYFEPDRSLPEQALPAAVMERKAGWYFVRFYDLQGDLMDSLDFRFAAGLKGIRVSQHSPLPSDKGHESTTVEFCHDADWQVTASTLPSHVKTQPGSERTIVRVPPTLECDRSEWLVGPRKGQEVRVVVLVERVRWTVGIEGHTPSQWQDKRLPVPREAFAATSGITIWIRLPRARWTERVFIGFCFEMRRGYEVKVTECMVAIPLRDFSDAPQLKCWSRDQVLTFWVEVNGTLHEASATVVHADAPKREMDIHRIPATRVACVLTELHRMASGPLRRLLKEVRRRYRRPHGASANRNENFVRQGLCVLAVFLQIAESRKLPIPRSARRWKAAAQSAGERFPEIMVEVWRRCVNLKGR
ncbi:MAG: hypothetical protein L0387_24545 [Acidobacteria bacterium]|nr:hypothetical protein [Acidobacteriota bacterium]MCI0721489.1 hypothetical protein [Acidobacteriota bacterium]